MHARMMAALSFERITVRGADALAEWERLRRAGRGWPLVVGNDEDLERIAEQFSIDDPQVSGTPAGRPLRSPEDILAASAGLSMPADLARWPGAYQEDDLTALQGEWPAEIASNDMALSVATDITTGAYHDRVHLLLIPTEACWKVPAYLRWGDWNACPPPEYHVAALRGWHERYGVELVGINGDTMNLRVSRRPGNRDEALTLARDQYRYCPDIVDQGVEALAPLAAILMGSDWWYFWWD